MRDRVLGRLATSIAITLMGKHKPTFHPSTDCGDYVVARNCAHFAVTGKKLDQHLYYSHSTKPGHLKTITMRRLHDKKGGGEVLRRAVSAMLPKNRLRKVRLDRLKTFEGEEHGYAANVLKRFDELRSSKEASSDAAAVTGTAEASKTA